MLKILTIC